MKHASVVLIATILLCLHERLSTSRYFLLGGIVPLLTVIALLYRVFVRKVSFSVEDVIAYIVLFIITLFFWIMGRYEYKKKEIEKMKAKDLS